MNNSEIEKVEGNNSDTVVPVLNESSPLIQKAELPSKENEDEKKGELLGLILMTLSAFAFSTMSLCVKIGNKKYPFFQSVFARSIFQVIGGYIGCKLVKTNPFGKREQYFLLVCRGLAGAVGMTLFFAGMTYLPLADNTVVFFTGPAITSLFAWVFLREELTLFDGVMSGLCLFGVSLVARPHFMFPNDDPNATPYNSVAFLLPFIGASMAAVAYVIVRFIGKNVHYLVHVFYFGLVSTVISFSALFILHVQEPMMPESLYDWFIHIVIAISAFIGQCLLNSGLQLCAAGPGTLMRNLDVVFAFIFGITILDEIPRWTSVIGALIILSCTVGMGLRKYLCQKKKNWTIYFDLIIKKKKSVVKLEIA